MASPLSRAAENRGGVGGRPEERGVAGMQVCFGVKLIHKCDH